MTTGCKFCDEIQEKTEDRTSLCLNCRLADAEHEMLKWMSLIEEIKKQIEREKSELFTG
jgi:hypothetical protein